MSDLPLVIIQTRKHLQGTAGVVFLMDENNLPQKFCESLELPWDNNKSMVSCIPLGEYVCKWTYSNTFKREMYLIMDTEPRLGVRLHSANRLSELRGCIALGERITKFQGEIFLANSRKWMTDFEKRMGYNDFKLKITSEDTDDNFRIYIER